MDQESLVHSIYYCVSNTSLYPCQTCQLFFFYFFLISWLLPYFFSTSIMAPFLFIFFPSFTIFGFSPTTFLILFFLTFVLPFLHCPSDLLNDFLHLEFTWYSKCTKFNCKCCLCPWVNKIKLQARRGHQGIKLFLDGEKWPLFISNHDSSFSKF